MQDVLNLSRGMSYKLAMAGVPIGGAKMVVIGDPAKDKTEALLRAIGRAVERFKEVAVAGHVTLRKGERSQLAELATRLL